MLHYNMKTTRRHTRKRNTRKRNTRKRNTRSMRQKLTRNYRVSRKRTRKKRSVKMRGGMEGNPQEDLKVLLTSLLKNADERLYFYVLKKHQSLPR